MQHDASAVPPILFQTRALSTDGDGKLHGVPCALTMRERCVSSRTPTGYAQKLLSEIDNKLLSFAKYTRKSAYHNICALHQSSTSTTLTYTPTHSTVHATCLKTKKHHRQMLTRYVDSPQISHSCTRPRAAFATTTSSQTSSLRHDSSDNPHYLTKTAT